jgi:hypothetical protein
VSGFPLFLRRTTKPMVAKMGALEMVNNVQGLFSCDGSSLPHTYHSPNVNARTTRIRFS